MSKKQDNVAQAHYHLLQDQLLHMDMDGAAATLEAEANGGGLVNQPEWAARAGMELMLQRNQRQDRQQWFLRRMIRCAVGLAVRLCIATSIACLQPRHQILTERDATETRADFTAS